MSMRSVTSLRAVRTNLSAKAFARGLRVIGNRSFTDETLTHLGIPGTRFASPHQAAESASCSRLLGGLHFPIGITRGAQLGREIGALVAGRLNVK